MADLRVHSMFSSISGEAGGFPQGTWCKFIRLQGCNLRCSWCDTVSSQKRPNTNKPDSAPGAIMTVDEIAHACRDYKHVLITGGEPLAQALGTFKLVKLLLFQGKQVQIETNGSYPIDSFSLAISKDLFIRPSINWVMDYKCPSSGMSRNMPTIFFLAKQIIEALHSGDRVSLKWVVADERDFTFALGKIEEFQSLRIIQQLAQEGKSVPHLISPLDGKGGMLKEMAERIKDSPEIFNNIIFSVQLHKLFDLP